MILRIQVYKFFIFVCYILIKVLVIIEILYNRNSTNLFAGIYFRIA